MISYDDVTGPEKATNWQYYNKKWIKSDDIYVEAGTYSNFPTFNSTGLVEVRKNCSNQRPDYALNFTTGVTRLVRLDCLGI